VFTYGTFAKKFKILINLQRENKHSKIASFCSVALKIVAKQQMVHTALSRAFQWYQKHHHTCAVGVAWAVLDPSFAKTEDETTNQDENCTQEEK
jgi:ABC-type nickel/cobalt efflux system permease component RcnA